MLNKATLIGNLGKDPEIRIINDTRKVANFSIATTEKWKDKASGEVKEKTTWHNCVAWSPLAEIVERFVHKGSQVYVEGKIANSSYEQEGVVKYKSEIEVKEIKLLGRKSDGGSSNAGIEGDNATSSQQSTALSVSDPSKAEEDLPF